MKDINIAKTLLRKRKEKGITQDELARYMGVSKASVSKWETGTSYPDIVFLPQLATYFDISIDELMGYDPQMTKEGIRALRKRLTEALTERPLDDTIEECRELIKKYYSCYPLLLQLGLFMLNNVATLLTPEEDHEFPKRKNEIIREVADLFTRIQEESDDLDLARLARKMVAFCEIGLGNPDAALDLLADLDEEVDMPPELLVATAYQMKGEVLEAKRTLQEGLYQNVVVQLNYLINYLPLVIDDDEAFEGTIQRADTLANAYDLPTLHPFMQLGLYMTYAHAFTMRQEDERTLEALEHFAQLLVNGNIDLKLHGDSYFNLLDPWFESLEAGDQLPRNTTVMKSDLANQVMQNPAFAALSESKRFQTIVGKLKRL